MFCFRLWSRDHLEEHNSETPDHTASTIKGDEAVSRSWLAARCCRGQLPWRLQKEMRVFSSPVAMGNQPPPLPLLLLAADWVSRCDSAASSGHVIWTIAMETDRKQKYLLRMNNFLNKTNIMQTLGINIYISPCLPLLLCNEVAK